MRLLFLTSRLPYPPDRGDRLRAFHFLRSLARKHEIHLISFIANKAEHQHIAPLKEYCRKVHILPMSELRSVVAVGLNIWHRQPLQALYYRSRGMQALIDHTLTEVQFDAVYVHLFRMAPYVSMHDDLYRIVDLTDVISQELIRSMPYRGVISRLMYAVERPRIERYEQWVVRHFEETWLISDHDRDILAASCPGANIQVVDNGVDTMVFRPTGEPAVPSGLILVGHMGVFHNVDAAIFLVQDILPMVRVEIPEATVKLVGAEPHPEVQALSRMLGVQVTGFVPNLNTVLNQSSVFVAPLRFAAGVQNKVLEAMAASLPVVTTSLVNKGIGGQPERELLVADEPEAIALQVIRLLSDERLRKRVGRAGREYVLQRYNWDLVLDRMQTIQEKLT